MDDAVVEMMRECEFGGGSSCPADETQLPQSRVLSAQMTATGGSHAT